MLKELPGWVVDDVVSVRAEVREWVGTTPVERWHLAQLCSRDATWAASVSGMRQRIFDQVDPLPASTIAALQRLRAQTGWGDGQ